MLRWRLAASRSIVLLGFVGLGAHAQSPTRLSYLVKSLNGAEIQVGAGQPPTVVAVFATWCTTCRSEFGMLDSLQAAYGGRGVRVLALSVDEADDAHVRKYVEARKTRVLVAHDGSGAVGKTFGAVGVPETYLIDGNGVVQWKGRGDLRRGLGSLQKALALLKQERRRP